jgi:hypothetical protein
MYLDIVFSSAVVYSTVPRSSSLSPQMATRLVHRDPNIRLQLVLQILDRIPGPVMRLMMYIYHSLTKTLVALMNCHIPDLIDATHHHFEQLPCQYPIEASMCYIPQSENTPAMFQNWPAAPVMSLTRSGCFVLDSNIIFSLSFSSIIKLTIYVASYLSLVSLLSRSIV